MALAFCPHDRSLCWLEHITLNYEPKRLCHKTARTLNPRPSTPQALNPKPLREPVFCFKLSEDFRWSEHEFNDGEKENRRVLKEFTREFKKMAEATPDGAAGLWWCRFYRGFGV